MFKNKGIPLSKPKLEWVLGIPKKSIPDWPVKCSGWVPKSRLLVLQDWPIELWDPENLPYCIPGKLVSKRKARRERGRRRQKSQR